MYYKRRPYRPRRRRPIRKKKTTKGKPQTFNKKVMKVLSRAAETKTANPVIVRDQRILPRLYDNAAQVINLMPTCVQGTAQAQRVGNSITTKSAILHLNVNMFQISNVSQDDPPKFVDIYIYSGKKTNNGQNLDLRKFMNYGNTSAEYNSTTLPESGNLVVNSDRFTKRMHKRITLWNPRTDNILRNPTNLKFAETYKFNITKFYKKKLLFDDSVSNQPTNDNLFISVLFTTVNGFVYADTQSAGNFDVLLQYDYEDL